MIFDVGRLAPREIYWEVHETQSSTPKSLSFGTSSIKVALQFGYGRLSLQRPRSPLRNTIEQPSIYLSPRHSHIALLEQGSSSLEPRQFSLHSLPVLTKYICSTTSPSPRNKHTRSNVSPDISALLGVIEGASNLIWHHVINEVEAFEIVDLTIQYCLVYPGMCYSDYYPIRLFRGPRLSLPIYGDDETCEYDEIFSLMKSAPVVKTLDTAEVAGGSEGRT